MRDRQHPASPSYLQLNQMLDLRQQIRYWSAHFLHMPSVGWLRNGIHDDGRFQFYVNTTCHFYWNKRYNVMRKNTMHPNSSSIRMELLHYLTFIVRMQHFLFKCTYFIVSMSIEPVCVLHADKNEVCPLVIYWDVEWFQRLCWLTTIVHCLADFAYVAQIWP